MWAFFFSYDLRNIALAVPFIGISIGIGTQHYGDAFRWVAGVFKKIRVYAAMVLIVISMFAANTCITKAEPGEASNRPS